MDSDPGWATEGAWQWGVPTGGGGLNGDPTSGYTGANVYGFNLNGDYTSNLPPTYLTTTPIDCTGRFDVQLRFQRWLGVESNFNFDEATVQVSHNGTSWTTIFSATGTGQLINDGEWTYQQFDLASIADNQPTVYIRWGMGPSDSSYNLPGWNIDDVQLFSAGCVATAGDWNGDSVVDLADFAAFAACAAGPTGGIGPTCGIFDLSPDGTVDLGDFAAFQRLFHP
jgi:hypothetical protein